MSRLAKKVYTTVTDAVDTDGESLDPVAASNFLKLLVARAGSKIGDRLSSPKTTLAWLLQSVGAPVFFSGLIVPLREAGSLLPQLFLARWLKRFSYRKSIWSAGAIVQGAAIAGCALVAITLSGTSAGVAILSLMTVFSLARGMSSIAAKDVLGKVIQKKKRGQLTGWAGSLSGAIVVFSTGFLFFYDAGSGTTAQYAIYLIAASLCWWAAAAVHFTLTESRSETSEKNDVFAELRRQLSLLRTDGDFRDFLLVRALAVGSGLSTPFIVTLAHERLSGVTLWLGVFIIAEGLAATVSSPFWGRWADRSSRQVMRFAMLLVSILLGGSIVLAVSDVEGRVAEIAFPTLVFLLGICHAGVRVGRKTFVVDMAEGDKRTDYVAVGNTLIGVLLLLVGVISGLLAQVGVQWALGILAMLAFVGALYAGRLPKVSG